MSKGMPLSSGKILKNLTFKMFLRCSTEISPLEYFRFAYVDRVDCSSYITTPRNREIPKKLAIKMMSTHLFSHIQQETLC